MSKAFVKDSEAEPELPEEDAPALPSGVKNYMTPDGHRHMQQELQRLLREERPKTVEVVAWAASNGDRSENGDYLYGKKRLREIDRRIRFLSKRLESAIVVDPAAQKQRDRVFFGAWVKLEDRGGALKWYRLVGPDEFDMASDYLSMDSPLGSSLLGKRLAEEITVALPAGEQTFTVVAVRYGPRPD